MSISDVMTKNPATLDVMGTAADAALMMSERDIGDVIVTDGDQMCGIVTDRDIVVRAVAENRNPIAVTVGEICTRDLTTLSPNDSISDAVKLMIERAVRRLPVVDDGRPVGIVSLGDLAVEQDRESALGADQRSPAHAPAHVVSITAIERDEVRRLAGQATQLVEVLPRAEFEDEHLPGAVSIPLADLGRRARSTLDPTRPVIVYCWDQL